MRCCFFGGAVDSTSRELTYHSHVLNHSFGESVAKARPDDNTAIDTAQRASNFSICVFSGRDTLTP